MTKSVVISQQAGHKRINTMVINGVIPDGVIPVIPRTMVINGVIPDRTILGLLSVQA